jgi:hypothetical protein
MWSCAWRLHRKGCTRCCPRCVHSIVSPTNAAVPPPHPRRGVIPRVIDAVYDRVGRVGDLSGALWSVRASYIELYREDVRDLLAPDTPPKVSTRCSGVMMTPPSSSPTATESVRSPVLPRA